MGIKLNLKNSQKIMSSQDKKPVSSTARFFKNIACAGGAAVITVSFIHPIDVVKTVLADEGAGAFYKGIGAAWMREASYTSLRIGLYEPCKGITGADKPNAGFLSKFCAGAMAGAVGSIAGNPFDVLKTRMMAFEGAENHGVGYFAKDVMEHQGFGGFYKGI